MVRRKLTGHEEIESISDITLVAGEVNTTALGGLILLVGSKLRSKGDTTAQNNASIFLVGSLVGFFFIVNLHIWGIAGVVNQRISEFPLHEIFVFAQVALVVGSRTHFTSVCGERTTQNTLLRPEIKVISECEILVILVGS